MAKTWTRYLCSVPVHAPAAARGWLKGSGLARRMLLSAAYFSELDYRDRGGDIRPTVDVRVEFVKLIRRLATKREERTW